MSQRYFLTAESTYEDLRLSLNTALQYPNTLGKSVFQTALYAPRDNFRRVLLAVDTDLPGYTTVSAAIAPLLASDAMEEIDEATYLAAIASATGGGASFTTVSDTITYSNFLTEAGGTLDDALSGIDSALTDRALAADFDQGVQTTDSPEFVAVTAGTVTVLGTGPGNQLIIEDGASVQFASGVSGAILSWDVDGYVVALPSGTSGQVLVSSSSAYGWATLTAADVGAAAASHAHSATSDLTFSGATAGQVLTVNGSGTALVWATPSTYTLPQATNSTLGGITVSTGLSVASGALSVSYGTSSGTACQGNDGRLDPIHPFLLAGM